ncbi:MAG: hydrogenase maturation nickel metallochaperone HypA [Elusimicrobia bacterium]|nr:hydrogenase maturation nickel metallochaperone HypA [Elusimicrobiota bacterium]
MHELAEARKLLKDIEKETLGKIPAEITIVVGKASGIDIDFLKHSFYDHIFPEKGWQKTKLKFRQEGPRLLCKSCGKEITELPGLTCPFCDGDDFEVIAGNRVYVEEVKSER